MPNGSDREYLQAAERSRHYLNGEITRLKAEVMAEHFSGKTLLEMSQLEIPAKEQIDQQIQGIQQKLEAASQNPHVHSHFGHTSPSSHFSLCFPTRY